MENIFRIKYYVSEKKSDWSEIKAIRKSNKGGQIKYKVENSLENSTLSYLKDLKINKVGNQQDKNINRKDFSLSFYIDCFESDVKPAKSKLKKRIILILHKHQKKIDKMLSNL